MASISSETFFNKITEHSSDESKEVINYSSILKFIKFKDGVMVNEIVNHFTHITLSQSHYAHLRIKNFETKSLHNSTFYIDWLPADETRHEDIARYFIRLGQKSAIATNKCISTDQIIMGGSFIINGPCPSHNYSPELLCLIDDMSNGLIKRFSNTPAYPSTEYLSLPKLKQQHYDHSFDYIEDKINCLPDTDEPDSDSDESQFYLLPCSSSQAHFRDLTNKFTILQVDDNSDSDSVCTTSSKPKSPLKHYKPMQTGALEQNNCKRDNKKSTKSKPTHSKQTKKH